MENILENNKALQKQESGKILLKEKIPLKKPLSLEIELTNICNFSCEMCPTGNKKLFKKVGRPRGLMDQDLFKKVIDNIEEMGGIKNVMFYGEGEPLLHPNYFELVDYAMKKNVIQNTIISTNASLLDEEIAEKLVQSGIQFTRISLYGINEKKHIEITRQKKFDFNRILNNVKRLFEIRELYKSKTPYIYIKVMEGLCSSVEMENFRQHVSTFTDAVGFEHAHDWDGSFEMKEKGKAVNPIDIKYCPKPWYELNVALNGEVRICCVDWTYGTSIGDINKNSLSEIWNSDDMIKFREMIVKDETSQNKACCNCTFFKRNSTNPDADNIDSVIEEEPLRALSKFPYVK